MTTVGVQLSGTVHLPGITVIPKGKGVIMTHYELADVRRMIGEIVKVDGDTVYLRPDWRADSRTGGCSYVHHFDANGDYLVPNDLGIDPEEIVTSTPGCIVGKMLVEKVGMDPKWFNESFTRGASFSGIADELPGHTFSNLAIDYLDAVQVKQDDGVPWAQAYAETESSITL